MDAVINFPIVHILSDVTALFQCVAKDFVRRAIKAVNEKQLFTVVLSGGETPKLFFDTLVKSAREEPKISWKHIKFFFGDERYVPIDDPASNYHLAYKHLFTKVPIPEENIYRIVTELKDPHVAAEEYERTLRKVFNIKGDELPLFDLVCLGLGVNAHTASLFPESDVVKAYLDKSSQSKKTHPLVVALWVSELNMHRITLTPSALNNSASVCFLVTGAEKALAVWEVLQGPCKPLQYPAQLIRCVHGETVWYLDRAAAEKLK